MANDCEKALSTLLAECRKLAAQARQAARGSPRSREMLDDLRKATGHIELAIDSIDLGREPGGEGRSLKTRVAGLAGRLARGGAPEGGKLADSIASLRRTRREMVREGLSGSSSCIALPDLLGFLHVQAKSGTLRVTLEREVLTIAFRDGELMHAFSDNSPAGCRLGEILVGQGALRREELQSFLVYHSTTGGKLGQALEVRDLVTEADLQKALDHQMQSLFARLFHAQEARFSFRDDEVPPESEDSGHNVMQLLLEGARAHDEARRDAKPESPDPIRGSRLKLPARDEAPEPDPDPID